MMEELETLGTMARVALDPLGLTVTGLHYYDLSIPQRKSGGTAICFEAETHDPNFFGKPYRNSRRIRLVDTLYQALGQSVGAFFPGCEVYLDCYVSVKEPYSEARVAVNERELREEFVDVTQNQDVRLVSIFELLRSGEVVKGSMFERYCGIYGIPYILKHGHHHISPDSASVEALQALCGYRGVGSVLEIGAGVGICGEAAKRNGISDFTFVDASKEVCAYLERRFPRYRMIHCDAFDFKFDRDWDVVLVGLPYELNPSFLEKRGAELTAHTETVILQSGIKAFFEFEHDWVAGVSTIPNWPWWKKTQTLGNYFDYVCEMALDWQLCLVGTNDKRLPAGQRAAMYERGFERYPSQYPRLTL